MWSKATHPLVPLAIGTVVSVQNQRGPNKTKWDNSGVIMECLPHSQYKVKLDGTGHVILRNRVALRRIVPYVVSKPIGSGLELDREASTGVQEGHGTLHPKAFLKPKTGEVVVGSSLPPAVTSPSVPVIPAVVSPSVPVIPVGQEGSESSEEDRSLVAPKATNVQVELEVSSPVVEHETAYNVPRRSS